jgi:hypothetical protein
VLQGSLGEPRSDETSDPRDEQRLFFGHAPSLALAPAQRNPGATPGPVVLEHGPWLIAFPNRFSSGQNA